MGHPLAILPPMMEDLARTEQELLRVVAADGDFLTDIASHLIKAGGKRVRPGFAMAAAAALECVDTLDRWKLGNLQGQLFAAVFNNELKTE